MSLRRTPCRQAMHLDRRCRSAARRRKRCAMWRARWSVRCVSCAPASWRSPTGRSSGHGRSDDGEFVTFLIHKELSMNEKTASVHWEGQGKKGLGKISTETGALKEYPYGFASRFEDDRRGTNPEELLGAAHAACFTMAFSFACDKAGLASSSVDTQGSVRLAKQGEGFVIDRIAMTMQATVPGHAGAGERPGDHAEGQAAVRRQRSAGRKQKARGTRDDCDFWKMVAQGPRRNALPTQRNYERPFKNVIRPPRQTRPFCESCRRRRSGWTRHSKASRPLGKTAF